MAEPGDLDHLPQATVVPPKRGRVSVIWIIPILAAVVAIGIAVQRILSEGPTITIVFTAADGIEPGKTALKYKDVAIGRVTAMRLSNNFRKVEVTVKIQKHAAPLMVDDAKFWVVRPSISLSGISGLNTLLSGNYIGFEPGTSEITQDFFVGLDEAPVITAQRGRQFFLKADDLGSLDVGSPIYYRRLPVGDVTGFDLAPEGNAVQLKIFVRAPYDKYVFPGTRFWTASGVEVSLNADGVNVRTESLVALLVGGLSFDTPPFEKRSEEAAPNAVFTLYNDRAAAMKAPDVDVKHYALYFNESLRGLSVGAPVTFLGLPAGEVTSVGLGFDAAKGIIRPRVVVAFSHDRLMTYAHAKTDARKLADALQDEAARRAFLRRLVEERGLRAQLRSGSLLTGQLYVAFDFYPKAPRVKVDLGQEEPELPVVPGTFAELEAKLTSVVDKIDRMPLEAIGNSLRKDLDDLNQTIVGATKLLNDADVHVMPQLKTGLEDLHRALVAVEQAMNSADASILGSNAPAQQELRDALQEFARAARSLRVLTDQLERQPSAVIRGKPDGGR